MTTADGGGSDGCNETSTGVLLISECYSERQNDAIAYTAGSMAFVSLICSLFIIQHVIRSKQLKTYHRLLIGLSFWDVVSSSTNLSAFSDVLTRGYDELAGTAACTAHGFFLSVSVGSAAFYNACLSIFFWMVVRFEVKDRTIARFEPLLHMVANLSPLSAGIAGIVKEAFNPLGFDQGCFFSPYPAVDDCDDYDGEEECWERGGEAAIRLMDVTVYFFYVIAAILFLTNLSMYCKIRRTEKRNMRFHSETIRSSLSAQQRTRNHDLSSYSQKVAVQSFLFCGGFVLTYQFSVWRLFITDSVGSRSYFVLCVLAAIFWPLQGFFDFLVYFRPRYLQWRRRNPTRSRWFAVKQATLTIQTPIAMEGRRQERTPTMVHPQTVELDGGRDHHGVLGDDVAVMIDSDGIEESSRASCLNHGNNEIAPQEVALSCETGTDGVDVITSGDSVMEMAAQRTEQAAIPPFSMDLVLDETDERVAETLQSGANTWYAANHFDST